MPDEVQRFEIPVVVTESGDTGKTVAGLKETQAQAEATAKSFDELAESERASQGIDLNVARPMVRTSQADIVEQRREILQFTEQQVAAETAGDSAEVARLEEIIAARRLALQIQQQAKLSETESLGRARDLTRAIAQNAEARQLEMETAQAQEALNQKLVAEETERLALEKQMQESLNQQLVQQEAIAQAEERRLNSAMDASIAEIEARRLATEKAITAEKAAQNAEDEEGNSLRGVGTAGRGSQMLGQGLGLGSLAGSIGFAVFGLMEGVRWINEWISGLNKSAEGSEKIGESIEQTNARLSERISLVRTDQQESEVRASIEEQIARYQDQAATIQGNINNLRGVEKQMAESSLTLINAEVSGLNRKLDTLDQITQAARNEAQAEQDAAAAEQQRLQDVDAYESTRVAVEKQVQEARLRDMTPEQRIAALQKQRGDMFNNQPGNENYTPEGLLKDARADETSDPQRAKALAESARELLQLDQQIAEAKKEVARSQEEAKNEAARKAAEAMREHPEFKGVPDFISQAAKDASGRPNFDKLEPLLNQAEATLPSAANPSGNLAALLALLPRIMTILETVAGTSSHTTEIGNARDLEDRVTRLENEIQNQRSHSL